MSKINLRAALRQQHVHLVTNRGRWLGPVDGGDEIDRSKFVTGSQKLEQFCVGSRLGGVSLPELGAGCLRVVEGRWGWVR